jgi:branched-chain amino acid transport system ATP-binding protein
MLLSLKEVSVKYGTARAVNAVTIDVPEGAVTSVIGANGAGKSTILKAIAGQVPLSGGSIWFKDKKIDSMTTHEVVRRGLTLIPEGGGLFPYISVLSNLKLGAFLRNDKAGIAADLESVFGHFPVLRERQKQRAGTLSGGERQMVAIGRALMAKPKLLLMDEPSVGLSPLMVDEVGKVINDISAAGISILLVEQNAGLVTRVSERGYVLEVGEVVLEGNIKELMNDNLVQRAFLGE